MRIKSRHGQYADFQRSRALISLAWFYVFLHKNCLDTKSNSRVIISIKWVLKPGNVFFGDFPSGWASEMELQYRPYPLPLPIFCFLYCLIIMFYRHNLLHYSITKDHKYLYWWSLVLRYCYFFICIFIVRVFCNIYVTPFVFATLLCAYRCFWIVVTLCI